MQFHMKWTRYINIMQEAKPLKTKHKQELSKGISKHAGTPGQMPGQHSWP